MFLRLLSLTRITRALLIGLGCIAGGSLVPLVSAESLPYHIIVGPSQFGKTKIINITCKLDLPVAKLNAEGKIPSHSTTTVDEMLIDHPCLGGYVVNSVGLFDVKGTKAEHALGNKRLLTLILKNAERKGLSSIIWVWKSTATLKDERVEKIMLMLKQLLPSIPQAIVNNKFEGTPQSNVAKEYSTEFGLELLQTTLAETNQLKQWMTKNKEVLRFTLPTGWEDQLTKLDPSEMAREMAKLTIETCDVVQAQLDSIQKQIAAVPSCQIAPSSVSVEVAKQPAPVRPDCDGQCNQNCQREERYCKTRILVCVDYAYRRWMDGPCLEAVNRCKSDCHKAYENAAVLHLELMKEHQKLAELEAATHEKVCATNAALVTKLTAEWQTIKKGNAEVFASCNKYKLEFNEESDLKDEL